MLGQGGFKGRGVAIHWRRGFPSILTTGALTPAYHRRIADNYEKYKYLFRVTSEAGQLAKEAIDLLDSMRQAEGFDRIFIMVQDVAHARAIGGLVAKGLEPKGWKVLGNEVYPTGALDYSTGLLKAKDQGAQLLFVWMDHPETAVLVKQWHDLKIPVVPVSGISSFVEQPGAWASSSGAVAYWLASPANAGNAPSNATSLTMKFYQAYTKRWLVEPEGYGTSSSYVGIVELFFIPGALDSAHWACRSHALSNRADTRAGYAHV